VRNENLRAALQAMGEPPTPELQATDARKQRELVVVMEWKRMGLVPTRQLVRLGAALELSGREETRPQSETRCLSARPRLSWSKETRRARQSWNSCAPWRRPSRKIPNSSGGAMRKMYEFKRTSGPSLRFIRSTGGFRRHWRNGEPHWMSCSKITRRRRPQRTKRRQPTLGVNRASLLTVGAPLHPPFTPRPLSIPRTLPARRQMPCDVHVNAAPKLTARLRDIEPVGVETR